ncbi:hypothetical protein A3460_05510 [Enterobacter roggenkampii]|uniref:gp53-like domain-containing protein n=1 Tax=Enterobacter roggenkampii TaxID=1812935 RepID=UPI0007B36FA3|nr:hypothetical protein [Enterobacter roggenkampii]KZP80156.1 hypothetical protein A3460_05510 [Enterobacter roggenkampii]
MHRIDTPTAQKDKFGAGKNGFTRGNPQTGTPATDLDDDYFDMLQEELAGVVEATGVMLDKSKHNQLLTALKSLLLSRAHPFADIKADGSAAVAEALSNLGLGTAATKNVGTGSNQLPDMSSFAASLSVSGWQKLPGGLIIQWGQVLSNSGGFAPWTYPIAFSTACFHVYATPFVGASANNFTLTEIGNPGLTAVTTACYVNGVQSSTAGQVGVRYLAIGY